MLLACAFLSPAQAADPAKVLRLALPDIAYLDPQQITDLYSTRVANVIFEGLYQFDYLASPARVVPNTAAAMPEITDGGRTWTIRISRASGSPTTPAFKGEAARAASPRITSIRSSARSTPTSSAAAIPRSRTLLVGARAGRRRGEEVRQARLRREDRGPARDRSPHAAAAADRRRLHGARAARRPRHATPSRAKSVEAAGSDDHDEAGRARARSGSREWRRGSRVVLEANPGYRPLAFPDSDDPALQPMVQAMKGRKLPALSRIEISIIEEQVPELLAFDQGDLDYIALAGSHPVAAPRQRQAQARVRAARHRPLPLHDSRADLHLFQPGRSGRRRQRAGAHRAAPRDRDGLRQRRVHQGVLRRPGAARQPAPAAGRVRPRPEAAAEGRSTTRPPRARSSTASATRTATATACAKRPTASRWSLVQSSTAGQREPRGRHAVAQEHGGDRPQDDDQHAAVQRTAAAEPGRPADDVQPGLPRRRPVGLQTRWRRSGASRRRTSTARAFAMPTTTPRSSSSCARRTDRSASALARRMSDVVNAFVPIVMQVYPIGNAFTQPWLLGYYPSQFGFTWKYMDIDLPRKPAK